MRVPTVLWCQIIYPVFFSFFFSPYHPVQHGQDLFWWIPERSVNPPPPSIFVGNEVIGLRQPPSFLLLTVAQIKETTRRGWAGKKCTAQNSDTSPWHLLTWRPAPFIIIPECQQEELFLRAQVGGYRGLGEVI